MWALKPISSRPGARATAGCGPLLSDNLNYPTGSECRPSLTPSSESPSPSQARANLWTGVPARRADCSLQWAPLRGSGPSVGDNDSATNRRVLPERAFQVALLD